MQSKGENNNYQQGLHNLDLCQKALEENSNRGLTYCSADSIYILMELSVRETQKYVFPFFHYTRIFKWIQEGVLVPSVHIDRPSGPTTKTMLDPLDMVVCAVIHSLFRFGSEMEKLKDTPVSFVSRERKFTRPPQIQKAGTGIFKFGKVGRQWQDYLKDNDCKVMVYWAPNVYENTIINVYPQNQDQPHKSYIKDLSDDHRPTFGHIFINTECWMNYVDEKLKAVK